LQILNKFQQGVVLAVEDDFEDVELLRLALAQNNCPWTLISVPFARDAIKYLARIGEYADETRFPWPTLIMLDLSLPGMSGMDFLTWARHEPNLPPIVILTYSKLPEDRALATRLGAKAYFVKSIDLNETTAMIETLLMLSTPAAPPSDEFGNAQNPVRPSH
jgi:DNA-binding response OmpR family regulator